MSNYAAKICVKCCNQSFMDKCLHAGLSAEDLGVKVGQALDALVQGRAPGASGLDRTG